jgi:hypothetical protein
MKHRVMSDYMYCITGFMVCEAAVATMMPERKVFDKGLIFVKYIDILLSGDKWTKVINIALDDYSALIDSMKLVLGYIRQKIQVQKNPKSYSFDVHWGEVGRLHMMNRELETDLKSSQKLLLVETSVRNPGTTSIRNKRELIDILGYGMKCLFGTADARDLRRLEAVCDE